MYIVFDLCRLNEGHTVFVERKITGRLHSGQSLSHFMALGRAKDLNETIVNTCISQSVSVHGPGES